MNLKAHIIYCSLLANMALPANADEFNKKLYLGLGAGLSNLSPDTNNSGFSIDDDQDFAGKLYFGMDFKNHWSAEVYYANLGAASLSNSTTSESGDIDYSVFGVSALYHFYNTEGGGGFMERTGWDAFGKLGVGSLDNSSNLPFKQSNSTHVMAGIGGEYQMESGLAIRLEAETFDTDIQLLSVGALWRFGFGDGGGLLGSDDAEDIMQTTGVAPEPMVVQAPEPEIEIAPSPVMVKREDSDNDGVSDLLDACPNTAIGIVANSEGCDEFSGILEGVKFQSASANISADSMKELDSLADRLLVTPNVRIAVMAHTDSSGPAVDNLELSKKRSLSVVRYLMSRGVRGRRLQPEAFGESEPLVSNATPEGRRANRRIDIRQIQ